MGIDTGAGHGYYVSLIDLTHRLQWYISVHSPSTVRCSVIPGSSGDWKTRAYIHRLQNKTTVPDGLYFPCGRYKKSI